MEIRKFLNDNRKVIVGVAILAIAGGLVLSFRSNHQVSRPVTQAFFSDDDGQTTFVDDVNTVAPFDHGGKPACLVRMYKTKNGEVFIAWLERYTERGRKQATQLLLDRKQGAPVDVELSGDLAFEIEVKRPHEGEWVRRDSPAGMDIVNKITSPDGSEIVSSVDP